MFNLYEEARALSELGEVMQRYDVLRLPFRRHDPLADLLNAYRFRQNKLIEHKLRLYPKTLIVLARYYRYHIAPDVKETKDSDPAVHEAKCRRYTYIAMQRWISALSRQISAHLSVSDAWKDRQRLCSPVYQIPYFGNFIPLEGILADAEYAGPLTELTEPAQYPEVYGRTDEKNVQKFWQSQLYAIAKTELQLTEKQETPCEIAKAAKSRRVRAVLMLALWYAEAYTAFRLRTGNLHNDDVQKNNDDVQKNKNDVYLAVDYDRLVRSMMVFSKKENFDRCFMDFREFLSVIPTPDSPELRAVCFRFAPISDGTDMPSLPDIRTLDDGMRLDDKKAECFGMPPEAFQALLNGFVKADGQRLKLIKGGENALDAVSERLCEYSRDFHASLYEEPYSLAMALQRLPGTLESVTDYQTAFRTLKKSLEKDQRLKNEMDKAEQLAESSNQDAEFYRLKFQDLLFAVWKVKTGRTTDTKNRLIAFFKATGAEFLADCLLAKDPMQAFELTAARIRTVFCMLQQPAQTLPPDSMHIARLHCIPDSFLEEEAAFCITLQNRRNQ